MRRLLGLGLIAILMAMPIVGFAGPTQTYKDTFPEVTYSGSTGSIPWEKPWQEIGDDGDPASGAVHVWVDQTCGGGKCAHMEGVGGLEVLGLQRHADLSLFEEAALRYNVAVAFEGDKSLSTGSLVVQVKAGGSAWTVLERHQLGSLKGDRARAKLDVSGFLDDGFAMRFILLGDLNGEVFLDNVEIKGKVRTGVTTTTSSTTTTTEPGTVTTDRPPSTTTTRAETTTTTLATTTTTAAPPTTSDDPLENGGLRDNENGVMADFTPGLFGNAAIETPEVMGVAIDANYSMAVEVISASWVWTVALLLLVVTAIISGLDRRRSDKTAETE